MALGREYPSLESFVTPVLDKIGTAKKLADERNGYVHGLIAHDFSTNETRLLRRGKPIQCDEATINNLIDRMCTLRHELNNLLDGLFAVLGEARTLPRWPSGDS